MDERLQRLLALRSTLPAFRGGAPLFPDTPDDLSGVDDDALQALLDQSLAVVERIQTAVGGDDPEGLLAERAMGDVLAEMEAGVEAIERIRGEQATRAEAAEQTAAQLAELAQRARGDAPAAEDDPDEGDGDDEPAPEPAPEADAGTAADADAAADVPEPDAEAIAAAAAPQTSPALQRAMRRPLRAGAPAAARPQPREGEGLRVALTAAADIPGFSNGQTMGGLTDVGRAVIARSRGFSNTPEGYREDVVVATIRREWPEARQLSDDNLALNLERVEAVTGREALVAAGGICAPVTPLYDLPQYAVADTPVNDSIPDFNASRGGIIFMRAPGLSTITTGIGVITAAQDAAGGAPATKTCQEVTCPAPTEVDVNIVYRCLQFRNLTARTFPEQVAQFTSLVMAAHAQMREVRALDAIKAASVLVTAASPADGATTPKSLGATSTLLGQIGALAQGIRSRHRMGTEAPLRLLLPAWIIDAMQVDTLRRAFGPANVVQDQAVFDAAIRAFGVTPTYYIDGPTGAGQTWPAQAAGPLVGFPPTVNWTMFPEGHFIRLDAGTLDLGMVRDSALNAINAYQLFAESFENIAAVGSAESVNVTSAICENGTQGGFALLACPAI